MVALEACGWREQRLTLAVTVWSWMVNYWLVSSWEEVPRHVLLRLWWRSDVDLLMNFGSPVGYISFKFSCRWKKSAIVGIERPLAALNRCLGMQRPLTWLNWSRRCLKYIWQIFVDTFVLFICSSSPDFLIADPGYHVSLRRCISNSLFVHLFQLLFELVRVLVQRIIGQYSIMFAWAGGLFVFIAFGGICELLLHLSYHLRDVLLLLFGYKYLIVQLLSRIKTFLFRLSILIRSREEVLFGLLSICFNTRVYDHRSVRSLLFTSLPGSLRVWLNFLLVSEISLEIELLSSLFWRYFRISILPRLCFRWESYISLLQTHVIFKFFNQTCLNIAQDQALDVQIYEILRMCSFLLSFFHLSNLLHHVWIRFINHYLGQISAIGHDIGLVHIVLHYYVWWQERIIELFVDTSLFGALLPVDFDCQVC